VSGKTLLAVELAKTVSARHPLCTVSFGVEELEVVGWFATHGAPLCTVVNPLIGGVASIAEVALVPKQSVNLGDSLVVIVVKQQVKPLNPLDFSTFRKGVMDQLHLLIRVKHPNMTRFASLQGQSSGQRCQIS
jgi:hypothetical protein